MSRELLMQALSALEYAAERVYSETNDDAIGTAITAIRAHLATPEQDADESLAAMTEERDKVFAELCASQACEAALREALRQVRFSLPPVQAFIVKEALAIPSDATALDRSNKRYAAGVLEDAAVKIIERYFAHDAGNYIRRMTAQLRKEAE